MKWDISPGTNSKTKLSKQGQVKLVSFQDINTLYNKYEYSPLDGGLVQACSLSIEHGLKSGTLQEYMMM
jgi:hypothetical protein